MDEQRKVQLKANKEAAKQRAREFIAEYLATRSCVDCGENDSSVLTFDHVRGEKKYNIADMVQNGLSVEAIKLEILNTDIRCFNCHSIRTHEQINSYRWRKVTGQL
jgi:hypothetical protein